MPSPPFPPPPDAARLSPFEGRRRDSRRLFRRALGASLVLHLVGLLLYPVVVGPPVGVLPRGAGSGPPVPEGLQVLALRELPPGEEQEPLDLPAEREPELPVPAAVAGPGARVPEAPEPGAGEPRPEAPEAPRRSAAELLRPGPHDPSLFGPAELPPLSDEERYRLQLAGRLEAWQDSVRAEMERQRRVTDWTRTDAEGNRWGVSPGQLHLGKVTLPLPFSFGTPPGRRDEIERRAWESEEIRRGAISGEIFETRRSRAEELRARREAERADTLPPPRRN